MAALATPTNSSAPPQTHRVSGQGRNVSGEGIKRAVSRGVRPPCHRGDSGTANIAAPKDSTTRAAKDDPVWSHCSAPAVRYEGKCGADSAHANHSENEPSMKGLRSSKGPFHFIHLNTQAGGITSADNSMSPKELVPMLMAYAVWGHCWEGYHVCFHCDDEVVLWCSMSFAPIFQSIL